MSALQTALDMPMLIVHNLNALALETIHISVLTIKFARIAVFRAVNSLQFQAKAAFPPQTVQRQTENLKMENVLALVPIILKAMT